MFGMHGLFVRFLLEFGDVLILFRIVWWTSVGKEPTSLLSAWAVLLYVVLNLCSFPVWCLGRMWKSIVSVPDHCLFIYIGCVDCR